jgi:hypothetical protein
MLFRAIHAAQETCAEQKMAFCPPCLTHPNAFDPGRRRIKGNPSAGNELEGAHSFEEDPALPGLFKLAGTTPKNRSAIFRSYL